LRFLRETLPTIMTRKNASYYAAADSVQGIGGTVEQMNRVRDILRGHHQRVSQFFEKHAPSLVEGWRSGTTSFRPIETHGREIKRHANDELVHVDAGAYGATHGNRVLRFFVNVNDAGEDRIWTTKGSFRDLYQRYGKQAAITPSAPGSLREGAGDKLRTGIARGLAKLNPLALTALDSSPYDRAMRRFHNFMKDTDAFQEDMSTHEVIRFAPFSAWSCFTDSVSHACIGGRHALVSTFEVPLANCRLKEYAPYHILDGAAA
jgi:hypothetical protein